MAKRKHDFDEADKLKILLWCARHCCLCGKATGVGIEVAHLETNRSDIDNAIPLCFDCHAVIGHYNKEHPRGKKYGINELKTRRDQVYEQHTRHLIAPVHYKLTQAGRKLPDVGFELSHLGNTYPVQARVKIVLIQGARQYDPITSGHYNGKYLWNLNPGFKVTGHFGASPEILQDRSEPLRAKIAVAVVDIYQREHQLLARWLCSSARTRRRVVLRTFHGGVDSSRVVDRSQDDTAAPCELWPNKAAPLSTPTLTLQLN